MKKIYVQTRMWKNGKTLYQCLAERSYCYVCGNATRIAKDVDDALYQIVINEVGISAEAASNYLNRLKREKRYLRDVYLETNYESGEVPFLLPNGSAIRAGHLRITLLEEMIATDGDQFHTGR